MKTQYTIDLGQKQCSVSVESDGSSYTLEVDGAPLELDARQLGEGEFHLLSDNTSHNVLVEGSGAKMVIHLDGVAVPVRLLDERQAARLAATESGASRGADGSVAVKAPMPGQVVKRLVEEGDTVSSGQGVIVVEAMKMENELRSPVDGVIKKILVDEGTNVEAGEDLVLIE